MENTLNNPLPVQPAPCWGDAVALAASLTRGELTSSELVEFYTERIHRLDENGPQINSVLSLSTTGGAAAQKLDKERSAGHSRGPLHGLPIVVKDNYNVLGFPTTGGSAALGGSYGGENAAVVQRMVRAGAIILAKTNMSELAVSAGMYGYSSAGGWTLNPHNPKRHVWGSSSGTAAAVAAQFAAAGLGTDTSGSVRAPASAAGLVGIRPTLGLISRKGVMPHSSSLDVLGPLTRSVRDAAMMLTVMVDDGYAKLDRPRQIFAHDYLASLTAMDWSRVRVGVVGDFFGGNEEVDRAVKGTIHRLRQRGACPTPVSLPPYMRHLAETIVRPLGDLEFKQDFETYLASMPGVEALTLAEVIKRSESDEVLTSTYPVNPKRVANLRRAQELGLGPNNGKQRQHILTELIPRVRRDLRQLYRQMDLDALVFPTVPCVAAPVLPDADPTYTCKAENAFLPTYVASAAGFPEITLPVGRDLQGMPIGFSLMGLPRTEQTLLNLASGIESFTSYNSAPAALP